MLKPVWSRLHVLNVRVVLLVVLLAVEAPHAASHEAEEQKQHPDDDANIHPKQPIRGVSPLEGVPEVIWELYHSAARGYMCALQSMNSI